MPKFAKNVVQVAVDALDELITTITNWFEDAKDAVLPGGSLYNWIDSLQDNLTAGGFLYTLLEELQTTLRIGGTIYDWISAIQIPFSITEAKLNKLKDALEDPLGMVKTYFMKFLYNVLHDWREGT